MKDASEKFAIIVRGYIGSGKTTLAKELAKKHRLNNLSTDYFLFSLFPYEPRSADEVLLAFDNFMCSLKNGIKAGKSFLIEGDSLPVDHVDRFQIILDTLAEAGYEIRRLILTVSDEEADRRRKKRIYVTDEKMMKHIKDGINASREENELSLDTTDIMPEEKFMKAEELLGLK